MSRNSRAQGALIGHAVGDAFGLPVEFRTPNEIREEHGGELMDLVGYGTWNQPQGRVSDDTDMALEIVHSLVQNTEFNESDIAGRFKRWSENRPVGEGQLTTKVLEELPKYPEQGEAVDIAHNVWEERKEGRNAGNGGLMRVTPIGIAFENPDQAVEAGKIQSKITHYDPRCQQTAGLFALAISSAIHGKDPVDAVSEYVEENEDDFEDLIVDSVNRIKNENPRLRNTGYTIHTFETAMWYGWNSRNPMTAIISVVNDLGGDTDTLAALSGALSGAIHGHESIPDNWVYPYKDGSRNAINSKQYGNIGEDLKSFAISLLHVLYPSP